METLNDKNITKKSEYGGYTLKDMEGVSDPLNLPRKQMIEALEYIVAKLKTTIKG